MSLGAGSLVSIAAGVAALGGAAAVAAAAARAADPRSLTQAGMNKFRANQVESSVQDFDAVIAASPRMRPFMWQRGLSLYYLGQYAEGAKQFRDDVAVNPNDTEEAIWTFLCEAQLEGPEAARVKFLQVGAWRCACLSLTLALRRAQRRHSQKRWPGLICLCPTGRSRPQASDASGVRVFQVGRAAARHLGGSV